MSKVSPKESLKESPKEYICVAPCFHKGHFYQIGQKVSFDSADYPKDKKGRLRHFEPVLKETAVGGTGEDGN